jgi:SAM-dependent methyltransferase
MRMYSELARWWPLLSPPSHYVEEAAFMIEQFQAAKRVPIETMLELGSGGGSNAFHFKQHFRMTLTDISPEMLEQSRIYNPECEHLQGDMRSLRLNRQFDAVFIHDAVCYLTTEHDLRAAMQTAAAHCRPNGVLLIAPDCVRETFQPMTDHHGEDGEDGSGMRFLEWVWDPDPADSVYNVSYAFLLRSADGSVHADEEHNLHGLFGRQEWLDWLRQAGFEARAVHDPWNRDIFVGLRNG